MADQLFLSYRLRGFTESSMLRYYERLLRAFPYSRLTQTGSTLRISAISWDEPPLMETPIESPPDIDRILEIVREFASNDCGVQLETKWDLWQFEEDWSVQPARVVLSCFGPGFESEKNDHLRIDFGIDTLFLPQKELPNHLFMAQSNIRSLLHLVGELDKALNAESRRLWTDSGENFAERIQALTL
jgi:hypothetical protein